MSDFRGDMYLYQGLTGGGNKLIAAMEKKQEEEKANAQEYKALQSMAESMGLLTKDQATVMDLPSLRGFVKGSIYNDEQKRITQKMQLDSMEAMRRFASDQSMAGFAGAFNDSMALDPSLADYYENGGERPDTSMAAFSSALQQFPGAAADERFSGFMGAVNQMKPDVPKSGTLAGDIDFLGKRFGVPDSMLKQLAVEAMASRGRGQNRTTRVNPDGTVEIIEGGDSGPTTSTKTDVQTSIKDMRKSMDLIDDLVAGIRWNDVGTPGVFGEHVLDKFLPMVGVGKPDIKRVDNRTKLKLFIQGSLRKVSSDDRFTEQDRKRIEALMPSDGWVENEEHAKAVLSTIQRVFARSNIRDMQALGQKIDIRSLQDAEVAGAMEEGLFTKEEALAEMARRFAERDKAK